jgi:competence protein ComEA
MARTRSLVLRGREDQRKRRRTTMLRKKFRVRSIKSLAILLGFVLAGGLAGGVAGAQLSAKPSSVHAAMAPATPAAASSLVDINSSSKADLSALPGIGDVYSQKIIDGRPYKTKTDLINKKIIPSATYAKIRDKIIATQPKK